MSSLKERLGCGALALGAAVVLVLFVVAVARSVQPAKTEAPAGSAPPASSAGAPGEAPGSRTLLGGIGPGDDVAGWRIERTRLVDGKRLAVDVGKGETGFTVWIARKGSAKALAPQHTDKYDFYVGDARTYGGPVPDGAENKVLLAIVERVKRTEASAPVPPGL